MSMLEAHQQDKSAGGPSTALLIAAPSHSQQRPSSPRAEVRQSRPGCSNAACANPTATCTDGTNRLHPLAKVTAFSVARRTLVACYTAQHKQHICWREQHQTDELVKLAAGSTPPHADGNNCSNSPGAATEQSACSLTVRHSVSMSRGYFGSALFPLEHQSGACCKLGFRGLMQNSPLKVCLHRPWQSTAQPDKVRNVGRLNDARRCSG
jgi:hypothetical protein